MGYKDQLITFCEVYRLWAIEGDNRITKILSFSEADEGMIIEPNIDLYRELKLRVLNGTHTLTCGIAFLGGFDTVKQAMDDAIMGRYIADVMQREIGPSILMKQIRIHCNFLLQKCRTGFGIRKSIITGKI